MHKRYQVSGVGWGVRVCMLVGVLVVTGCQPVPAGTPTAPAEIENQPIAGGPTLLREGIALRQVTTTGGGSVKLVRSPANGEVYVLTPGRGIFQVNLETGDLTEVAEVRDIIPDGQLTGLTIGPDGTFLVVANQAFEGNQNVAMIRKGVLNAEGRYDWSTLALTEPYPLSNTPFDHMFNGIVYSPDGQWVYVNSGSRTDHGEEETNKGAFKGVREAPLTSKIFRLPADSVELTLPNDEAALSALGVIFAHGTRNAFDLEFAPNGDLFGVDNGPDADYPDELNWLREGLHYGFPWRFGTNDNPQQFPDYSSLSDKRLHSDFTAVQIGAYRTDPDFPKPPGAFTDPVINLGPDATKYRGDDGQEYDAFSEGKPLHTFTPHRSPLGLVFGTDASLPASYRSEGDTLSAFVLSWGAAGGTLSDRGQDLLHLRLTKTADNYTASTHQIVRGFQNPIDAVFIGNHLYVLDFGGEGAIWELTFN